MYRHLFGPVPSRRLGLSLGVDLLKDKTCSFDCVFCEVGRTSDLTVDRKEYVASAEILSELQAWLQGGGKADHITLAGKGEPTLNTGFGEVVREIKKITETPVAILSNGSLFHLKEVRTDALPADVVKISLSAWDQASFDAVNRPYAGLSIESVVEGYGLFRDAFQGELWLEVLLVAGVNDHVDNVARIAALAGSFAPDKIHINTVVRPGAYEDAKAVGRDKMDMLARLFDPPGEVVVDYSKRAGGATASIREILMRRPCTIDDLVKVSSMEKGVVELLLVEHGCDWNVESRNMSGGTYYSIVDEVPDEL